MQCRQRSWKGFGEVSVRGLVFVLDLPSYELFDKVGRQKQYNCNYIAIIFFLTFGGLEMVLTLPRSASNDFCWGIYWLEDEAGRYRYPAR